MDSQRFMRQWRVAPSDQPTGNLIPLQDGLNQDADQVSMKSIGIEVVQFEKCYSSPPSPRVVRDSG